VTVAEWIGKRLRGFILACLIALIALSGYGPNAAAADGSWWIENVPVYPRVSSYWEKDVRGWPVDPRSADLISQWNAAQPTGLHLGGNLDGTKVSWWTFGACYGASTSPAWMVIDTTTPVMAPRHDGTPWQMQCAPNLGGELHWSRGDNILLMWDLVSHELLGLGGIRSIDQTAHVIDANSWSYRDLDEADADAGLDKWLNPSCLDCKGHRGLDVGTFGWRFNEVLTQSVVEHLVEITLPIDVISRSAEFFFPYTGGEPRGGFMPEGARLRLTEEAWYRLSSAEPNHYVRVMLNTLYYHGALVGDTGGEVNNMSLENPAKWSSLGISRNSLSNVKPTDFEVVELGRSGGGLPPPPPPPPQPPPPAQPALPGLPGQPAPDTAAPLVRVSRKAVLFNRRRVGAIRVTCPASEPGGCGVALRLRRNGRVLGRKTIALDGGQSKPLRVRLTRKAFALLNKRRRLRARAVVTASDDAGNRLQRTRTLTLKAPRRALARNR
jgi:hypothetical protein